MEIRQVTLKDLDEIVALERLVWKEDSGTYESMKKRIEIFPEGFCVVYSKGKLVGMANSALLPLNKQVKDYDESFFPWERIHDPKGKILYLFCSTVHPDFRGLGIWKKMLNFRINYAKKHAEIKKIWVAARNKDNQYGIDTASPLQKYGFSKIKDFLFKGEMTQTLLELLPPYEIFNATNNMGKNKN